MTICLALLCDDARKVVAVADRMVSVEFLSLEFEQHARKVERIGKQFVALTAGDALGHTEILGSAIPKVERISQPTVGEVAGLIEAAFIEARQKLAEKTVLCRVGLDYPAFIQQQKDFVPEIVFGLMTEYQNVELDLEFLIAGVDQSGGHIYQITDPGISTCFDALGYIVIGTGLPHAEGFLTEADYSAQISLERALWLCYVAKRRSERAPGVGKETDIIVIDDENGVRFLSEESLSALTEVYQQYLDGLGKASDTAADAIAIIAFAFEEGRVP